MNENIVEMKDYIIKLYSENPIEIKERKEFLWSIFSSINKFNDAIGYKEEIKNCPNRILFDKMRTPYEGNVIAEFFIPIKKQRTFPNSKSVFGKDIAEKWVKFLKKVYPMLNVSLEIGVYKKIPLVEFATQYFISAIERDTRCTIEFAASEYLTDKEKEYILSKIQPLSDFKLSIHQGYCETCEGYHPNSPIHTEIEYQ